MRFLEDGTGNLHTSVLGGSVESIGSLLDSHHELDHGADDMDALISSLTNYDNHYGDVDDDDRKAAVATGPRHPHVSELRTPGAILQALKSPIPESGSDIDPRIRVQDLVDTLINPQVVDQRQMVVHLEPDDPNSIDSGSILSELDFEETLSNITAESTKTSSLNSTISQPSEPPSR